MGFDFGLLKVISAVKSMKNKGTSAVLRLWMADASDDNVNKVLAFAQSKGFSPINVTLAKQPSADEMASSGDELPKAVSIAHEKLDGIDDILNADSHNILLLRNYDLSDDDTKKYVLNAINRHGFTNADKWPDNMLIFMVDYGRTKTQVFDIPADSLDYTE